MVNLPRASPATEGHTASVTQTTKERSPIDRTLSDGHPHGDQQTRDEPEQVSMEQCASATLTEVSTSSAYPETWQDCPDFVRFKDAFGKGSNWQQRAYPAFQAIDPDTVTLGMMLADLAEQRKRDDWHAPQPETWLKTWAAGR